MTDLRLQVVVEMGREKEVKVVKYLIFEFVSVVVVVVVVVVWWK